MRSWFSSSVDDDLPSESARDWNLDRCRRMRVAVGSPPQLKVVLCYVSMLRLSPAEVRVSRVIDPTEYSHAANSQRRPQSYDAAPEPALSAPVFCGHSSAGLGQGQRWYDRRARHQPIWDEG